MTINTKYNIRENIYSMYNNKVIREHIVGISATTKIDHKGVIVTKISYETNNYRFLREDELFSSKEELLATL